MKKFAKILSILLCVAMLAGMIAMVVSAEESVAAEASAERDPSSPKFKGLPTPDAGYYDAAGNFVSAHWENKTFGNPANMVDGNIEDSKPWYASCGFEPNKLKQNGGDLVPVIIFDMSKKAVRMNGLNIWSFADETRFVDFHVDVKTSVDGQWETVGTYKDVNNDANGYHISGDEFMYYFDETVTAYALRIVVDKFEGKDSANVYQIYEIMPMVVAGKNPNTPDGDIGTPVLGGLPTPDAGYYDENNNFTSAHWKEGPWNDPANLVDGNVEGVQYASYGFEPSSLKQNGGKLVPVIIFDMGRANVTLNGLNIWSYTGKTWFIDFHVDVKTSVNGEWKTVATYTDVNNTDEHDYRQLNDNGEYGDEYLYYFDETVTVHALRIIVDKFEGKESANVYQIYEIAPLVVEQVEDDEDTEDTTPETSKPEESKPEESKPEESKPETSEPDATKATAQTKPSNPGKPTEYVLNIPQVGYYDGEGNFVSAHWENPTFGNPVNLVDGNYDGPMYASCHFEPTTLKQNGGDLVPVIIFDMGNAPITLNGLNIWSWCGETWMIDFHVDVKTTDDGQWETVATYKNVIDPDLGYWIEGDEFMYYFGETVTAYEMRIVIDTFVGKAEANVWQIYEILPLIAEIEEEPTDPEVTDPEVTDPEVTDPEVTDPEVTDPEVTDPEVTDPEATEPEATEPEDEPSKTGNIALSVVAGMIAISAIGGGILISKKKEF